MKRILVVSPPVDGGADSGAWVPSGDPCLAEVGDGGAQSCTCP